MNLTLQLDFQPRIGAGGGIWALLSCQVIVCTTAYNSPMLHYPFLFHSTEKKSYSVPGHGAYILSAALPAGGLVI